MKGDIYPSETTVTTDRVTGVPVTRLTHHKGHSTHLYFTMSGWYDDDRRLLFSSDRHNSTDLYSLELATGQITQLTEANAAVPGEIGQHGACLNPTRAEAYFWRGHALCALDLVTLEERLLCTVPADYSTDLITCTADGRYVCTSQCKATRERERAGSYTGYYDFFLAPKQSRLIRIDTETGALEVLLEDTAWLNHVNCSPTQAHLLTFCHEGPWLEVEQRVWGMDLHTGKVWKVRPQGVGEAVGHEYWMSDGVHVGYHGVNGDGLMYGAVRYDNAEHVEAPFPNDSRHFHSRTLDLIVGDGRPDFPYILLWEYRDGAFTEPRALCWHQCSWQSHQVHVHPCLSPDGRHVLYVSDQSGYGNIHLAPIPPLETLPTLEDVLTGPKRPWVPFAWMKDLKKK